MPRFMGWHQPAGRAGQCRKGNLGFENCARPGSLAHLAPRKAVPMSLSDTNQDSGPAKAEWFATTHWSVVLAAGDSASPRAAESLETLCRTYWYPLYAYVRRQGHSPEDAQDLTQGFFARFLENKSFRLASPARGRFRT